MTDRATAAGVPDVMAHMGVITDNIVGQVMQGSPAALAYCSAMAAEGLSAVQGRHLKAVASKLARELPYLPGTAQEAALRVLEAVQIELQSRPGNCAECGEVETPLSELCSFCGHTL